MEKCVKAINQILEIDMFFNGEFAVCGSSEALPCQKNEPEELKETEGAEAIVSDDSLDKNGKLLVIAEEIKTCNKCGLSAERNFPVPGEGDCNARLVFVGEGPGEDEDSTGRPFVGRSGKLLTKIIESMGLTREQVFICNTVKCHPPKNRDPLVSEKEACWGYLKTQLEIIQPDVIVALGSHAAKELLKTDLAIGKLRGKFHDFKTSEKAKTIKLMPTYHPAYLLRNYSVENRKNVWEDMQLVMKELGLEPPKK